MGTKKPSFADGSSELGVSTPEASEAKPCVLVPTFRTLAECGAGRGGVNGVAADAVKDRLAALALETSMVPAIVIKPQPEKYCADDDAINHRGGGKFEHSSTMAHRTTYAKRCQRQSAKLP